MPETFDANNNLNVNIQAGGGSGSNAAAGPTGSPVPADADYVGFNSSGNLVGVSSTNPLPITGSISASNPSVGTDGAAAPTSSTQIGSQDGSGNLQAASSTNPLPVTVKNASIPVTQSTSPWVVSLISTTITGNVAVTQATSPWVVSNSGTFAVQAACTQTTSPWVCSLASTTVTGTVAVTQSTSPWTVQGDSASGAAKAGNPVQIGGVFNTTQPTITTGQTVESQYTARGAAIVATGVDAFAVTLASTTITGTVGVTQSTSPWVVSQATASNLNATVVPAAAAVFEVSPTTAANTNANPFFNSITDGTTKVTVIAATTALKTDLSSVAGTATVIAAAGIQKVGITGNTSATLDSTIGAATAPTNALATLAVFQTTIPALTAGQAVAVQCDTTGAQCINTEGRKATYRAFASAFTPVTSATSPSFSIKGSATKTVRITRIRFSLTSATGAAAFTNVILQRFSALSGGTAGTTPAAGLNDTNNAAATAVVNTWSTLNTTATASGGPSDGFRYPQLTAGTGQLIPAPYELDAGGTGAQSLVLRGASQWFGIILNSLATTPICDITVEWTEE